MTQLPMASLDMRLLPRCGAALHVLAVDGGPHAYLQNAGARGPNWPAGNPGV